jgi:hypothetical protein
LANKLGGGGGWGVGEWKHNRPWVLGTFIYERVKLERGFLNQPLKYIHHFPPVPHQFFICPASTRYPEKLFLEKKVLEAHVPLALVVTPVRLRMELLDAKLTRKIRHLAERTLSRTEI